MSRLPFELVLALRYLRPKRTFVSVITLISVLGVTLGVAVLIIVISVMTGFDRQLQERIIGFKAHLHITQWGGSMTNYAAVADLAAQNPHVRGVAPFVLGQVLMQFQQPGEQPLSIAPFVRGVDLERENSVSGLLTNIIEGTTNLEGRGVILGKVLAGGLNVMVGDRVTILSPSEIQRMKEALETKDGSVRMPDDYEVRGIFDAGYYEYNAAYALSSLESAQELYDLGDSVHGLQLKLDQPELAAQVRAELRPVLGPDYQMTLWTEEDSALLEAIAVEKSVMFYILFFIMIVAALCILSALITFVVQKTREIGMLKAIGATNWQISGIFLAQSAFVGLMGVIAGYGLGMLAVTYRNEFLRFMRTATGWELFPASIYGFAELPALIVAQDVVLICTSAFIICVMGGVIPAWQAGRLKPVEALRHE
jgi:lipoprotein-releasing system permease protein